MMEQKLTYFAFPFLDGQHVVGILEGNWFWFYDCFIETLESKVQIDLSNAKLLFLNYMDNEAILNEVVYLNKNQIIGNPKHEYEEYAEIFFDKKEAVFKAKIEDEVRQATFLESLLYTNIITSKDSTLEELKQRILEIHLGFIPSFQYQIESTYQSFFQEYTDSINEEDKTFTKDIRKKTFNTEFKNLIVPFLKKHGFVQHTKTSKRCVKRLENGLSVFLFFEYKNFGYGAYEVSTVYFDEAVGGYESDDYLVKVAPNFPYSSNLMMQSYNAQILNFDIRYWMRNMELYLLPFIEKHKTHQKINSNLESIAKLNEKGIGKQSRKPAYYFELPSASRKIICLDLLKEKSMN